VVLVQRVCGWAGLGISFLWFRRLLPNELREAMVTWLPVMSAGVAVDVLCAVFCLAAGLLQYNAY